MTRAQTRSYRLFNRGFHPGWTDVALLCLIGFLAGWLISPNFTAAFSWLPRV